MGLNARVSDINRKLQEVRDQDQRKMMKLGNECAFEEVDLAGPRRMRCIGWKEWREKGREKVCEEKTLFHY